MRKNKFSGIHWSQMPNRDEILKKIADKKRGKPSWNKGLKGAIKNPLKGKKLPDEWAKKCAEGRKKSGMYEKVWNKGLTAKDSDSVLAGDKHYAWKDNNVGAVALHKWIYRKFGSPMVCECCGKECENNHQIHWANRSNEYKRDRDDWIRLCASCHKRFDMVKFGKAKLLPPKQI